MLPEEDEDQHRQHDTDDGDGAVLARQVGRGALLDGAGDFLHAGVAGVLAQDPAALHEAVDDGGQAARQRYVQRHGGGHGKSSSSIGSSVGWAQARAESPGAKRLSVRAGCYRMPMAAPPGFAIG
jgi:hypothetical protein